MIEITAKFNKNKVQGTFDTFEEVYEWLATVQLLHTEKKKQCIGFMGKTECADEPENDEKETD